MTGWLCCLALLSGGPRLHTSCAAGAPSAWLHLVHKLHVSAPARTRGTADSSLLLPPHPNTGRGCRLIPGPHWLGLATPSLLWVFVRTPGAVLSHAVATGLV